MEMENCFAYIRTKNKSSCFALGKIHCQNCSFYQEKEEARKRYMKNRVKSLAHGIDSNIDQFFLQIK